MAKSDPDILVICFKPFAGKGRNGSEEVGKRLAETSSRVECEVFEVVWADLHQRVQAVVTKRNYRWVVVLGEGYAHAVVVERVAYKAAAFPDERNERSGPLPPELPSSYVGDLAWPGSSKGKRGPRLPQKHELGLQHPNCGVIEG